MGCDIHAYCEVKRKGKWVLMGDIFPYVYYDPSHPEDDYNTATSDCVFVGRNYELFGILAGVRGSGDAFIPPRGVPNNASKEFKKIVDGWGSDGHTHHWYTLKELLEYDWFGNKTYSGYVSVYEYAEYKKDGRPSDWYDSKLKKCKVITNEEMDEVLKKHKKEKRMSDNDEFAITYITWKQSHSNFCGDFTNSLSYMKLLGDPKDVRMVFFFDN